MPCHLLHEASLTPTAELITPTALSSIRIIMTSNSSNYKENKYKCYHWVNTVPASRLIVLYISSYMKADTVIIPIFQLKKLRLTLGAK